MCPQWRLSVQLLQKCSRSGRMNLSTANREHQETVLKSAVFSWTAVLTWTYPSRAWLPQEGLVWCQPGHWESGGTNSLHTCWRMAGAPRVSIDWYFPCCGTRMQKSTLHFRACGTIQAVTALDAEVREALFPTSTARCYKNVLYRTALRAGPEAIPAPACLPPVANSNSIVQPVALEARDSCTS